RTMLRELITDTENQADDPSAACEPAEQTDPTRREAFQMFAQLGIGSAVFRRALAVHAEKSPQVTVDMIRQAEWIAGITLTDAQRRGILAEIGQTQAHFQAMRKVLLPNDVPPALLFHPAPLAHPGEAQS